VVNGGGAAPAPAGTRLVSIVVPAYNEAATLGAGIAAVTDQLAELAAEYRFETVIVDDGSTDGTGAIAAALAADREGMRVVGHAANRGLGAALRTGFAATRGEVVVVLDADMSYAPWHVPRLLAALRAGGAAVAAASPYAPGGSVRGVPRLRLALSVAANRLLRAASGGAVTTATGMVRAYDGAFIRSLRFTADGMEVNAEIVRHALRAGARIVEVPACLDWSGAARASGGRGSSLRVGRQIVRTLRLAAALLWDRATARAGRS
jgi:glycosyltransferase involved in cell wall biosynthesis